MGTGSLDIQVVGYTFCHFSLDISQAKFSGLGEGLHKNNMPFCVVCRRVWIFLFSIFVIFFGSGGNFLQLVGGNLRIICIL